MRHISLQEHLCFLTVGWRGKSYHTENTRADALGDCLDGVALAGGIAPLEEHDNAQPLGLYPMLQMTELDLEFA